MFGILEFNYMKMNHFTMLVKKLYALGINLVEFCGPKIMSVVQWFAQCDLDLEIMLL